MAESDRNDKIRLGGMALLNGVLVHGPSSWACAVRTRSGEVKVASDYKRLRAGRVRSPLLREVLGEGDYDFEWIEGRGGTRSPLQTPLWDAVAGFVAEVYP